MAFFGIGIEKVKFEVNLGTLWRTAHNLGASFLFTIGRRYKVQASDTTKARLNLPMFEHLTVEDFYANLPFGCQVVGVEMQKDSREEQGEAKPQSLVEFAHPQCCVYLLGAEDHGLTKAALLRCHKKVFIPTGSLNVASVGAILMWDRKLKEVGAVWDSSNPKRLNSVDGLPSR